MKKRLDIVEVFITLAAMPVLLFPTLRPALTVGAMTALVLIWLARWRLVGQAWPITRFNHAMLLFTAMIPVGILVSAFPQVTLPKATGLLLGLAVFRTLLLTVRDRQGFAMTLVGFCILGFAMVSIGVVSARWLEKIPALTRLGNQIPRLFTSLPEMRSESVHPNSIAAILTLCLPIHLGLVRVWRMLPDRRWTRIILAIAGGIFVLLEAGILVITQSRTGWISAIAGLLALWAFSNLHDSRRWIRVLRVALPIIFMIIVFIGVFYAGPQQFWAPLSDSAAPSSIASPVGSINLAGRMELWGRALVIVRDMPFTGCGLGAFYEVVRHFYPVFQPPPDYYIAHAHNLYLQTALDLGLPGLIGYLGLLANALRSCWRTMRRADRFGKLAAVSLAAGLIAFHVYGLNDALALGTKPSLLFWIALALTALLDVVFTNTLQRNDTL